MFKNYLLTAVRNTLKNKLFSVINLLGLAIGLTVFILIALYVQYEQSYDSFLPNSENLYRMETRITPPGMGDRPGESHGNDAEPPDQRVAAGLPPPGRRQSLLRPRQRRTVAGVARSDGGSGLGRFWRSGTRAGCPRPLGGYSVQFHRRLAVYARRHQDRA